MKQFFWHKTFKVVFENDNQTWGTFSIMKSTHLILICKATHQMVSDICALPISMTKPSLKIDISRELTDGWKWIWNGIFECKTGSRGT